MRKLLILFLLLPAAMGGKAQYYTTTFSAVNADGKTIYYGIADAANKKVGVTQAPSPYAGTIIVPESVEYGGETYTITEVGDHAFLDATLDSLYLPTSVTRLGWQILYGATLKHFCIPDGVEVLPNNLLWVSIIDDVWFNTSLKRVEMFSLWNLNNHGKTGSVFHGFAESNIEEMQTMSVPLGWWPDNHDFDVLPSTMRIMGDGVFMQQLILDSLRIPLSMESLGSGNYSIAEKVYISHTTPFTLGTQAFGTVSTLNIFVPVDCTAAYEVATNWSDYTGKYREQLSTAASGYTTYYLENENFEVPTGCTAYIITGATAGATTSDPYDATVVSFPAGSLIPKQTGFILQGTAPNTVHTYKANVSGTEVSVTSNLMVGAAVDTVITASANEKLYIFSGIGDGTHGAGFYYQGTRAGQSIKLKAHKAGLRLPSSMAPANGLRIDFSKATPYEGNVTGVNAAATPTIGDNTAVYDLQGRRVQRPAKGLYIINGKKVIQ